MADWQNYPELRNVTVAAMNDLIEENWKVLGLENMVLKYIERMRIGQTIKRITTHNVYPTSKFIYWQLESNNGTWYELPLILT